MGNALAFFPAFGLLIRRQEMAHIDLRVVGIAMW